MKKYWVIMCGGFMGSRRFDSEAAAADAAENMTALSGKKWTVREIVERGCQNARGELIRSLGVLSSGTVAPVIGSEKYYVIDRVMNNVILYASRVASDEEVSGVSGLDGLLGFIKAHKSYVYDI